jgi:hypothetical protein
MIKNSTRKDKRFMLDIDDKKIHFGSPNGFTYIDGATEKTKDNYLKRHVNEDWTEINPASLSRFILWGNSRDINKNITTYFKRFGI